jgi:hypothetical protein
MDRKSQSLLRPAPSRTPPLAATLRLPERPAAQQSAVPRAFGWSAGPQGRIGRKASVGHHNHLLYPPWRDKRFQHLPKQGILVPTALWIY